MAYPFLFLALALSAGILIGSLISIPFLFQVSCLFLSLAGAWIFYIFRKRTKIAFLFIILTTCVLGSCLYSHALKTYEENSLYRLKAADYIDFTGTLYKSPSRGLSVDYLYLKVNSISYQGKEERISGRLRVSVVRTAEQSIPSNLAVHDEIKVSARLSPLLTFQNFNQKSQKRYLQFLNIHNRASTKTQLLVETIASRKPLSPFRFFSYLRQRLQKQIEQHFPSLHHSSLSSQGAILEALLLGERGRLDEPTTSALQASGLYHLFAISGAHIAIISFFFFSLLRIMRIPSRMSYLLLIVFLVFYLLLVEGRPSVLRASIMTIAFLIGKIFWKDVNLINTLSISAFILLFFNPFNLFALGFQLTFAATLSIVLFFPKIIRYLPRLPLRISEILVITVTAQLGVLPFLAASFNRVTFSSLLLNYAGLPLVALIMAGGYLFLPLSLVNPWAAQILTEPIGFCIDSLLYISRLPSGVSFLSYRIPTPHLTIILGYFTFLLLFLAPIRIKKQRVINTALFFLFLILLVSHPFPARSRTLKVTFIDVGQGDSILVEFPGQRKMLIDGGGIREGSFDIGERVVAPFLWRKGIKRIDTMVLTHPHADHMNGLASIARNFKPQEFWHTDFPAGEESYYDFSKALPPELHTYKLNTGDSFSFGKVELDVLHPQKPEQALALSNHSFSMVMLIKYGKTSFLLTGDIEALDEKMMMDNQELGYVQVLKSPHHGSRSSSSREFLAAVSPEIVVVSVGSNNPYDLPSPDVILRYRQMGAEVYRTDIHGAVEISSDGEEISIHTSHDSERN